MMVSEEDKQSVGYMDMRQWLAWLADAPFPLMMLACQYPPTVYRLTLASGELGPRVFPVAYEWDRHGQPVISVAAMPALNPDLPRLVPHKISAVDPKALTPIKWPPDARVH